jgi:hypothetical protein
MPLIDLMNQVSKINCEQNNKEYAYYDFYIVLDTGKEILLGDFIDQYKLNFHYITRFSKIYYNCKAIKIDFPLNNNEVRLMRTRGVKKLS